MACIPAVTVQSQICGALTFSSMISHLPASKKQLWQVIRI